VAVYCGIDWAEGHQDIALVEDDGQLIAERRINETLDGVAELTAMLAAAGDSEAEPIPVAIETPRGLLIAVLRATGRPNLPDQSTGGGSVSTADLDLGQESDHVDAMALANILRTCTGCCPTIAAWPGQSPCSRVPIRTRYGGAPSLCKSCGLGCGSTPRLSCRVRRRAQVVQHPAGQQRRPRGAGHRPQPGRGPTALPGQGGDRAAPQRPLNAVCDSVDQLTAAVIEAFTQHPDYEIITSFPGLADISGAIVLAEIGDDRTRFVDDCALQAFAGSAPVTRASGKSRTVTRRRTKNNRLAAIGYSWAFTAAARPSPTREHYLHRRQHGDGHPAALRHLFNRMLGQLHHCLHTSQRYDPVKALPHAEPRHAGPVPHAA